MDAESKKFFSGQIYPDVIIYDDGVLLGLNASKTHKINRICIIHDEKYVYGCEIHYQDPQRRNSFSTGLHLGHQVTSSSVESVIYLEDDEFITECGGSAGSWVDSLVFTTNKGRKISGGGAGGTPFLFIAPENSHFATVAIGIGSYLCNIELRPVYTHSHKRKSSLSNERGSISPFEGLPMNGSKLHRSKAVGSVEGELDFFDDNQEHFQDLYFDPQLASLVIYSDDEQIVGLAATYRDVENRYGPFKHFGGKATNGGLKHQTLTLSLGDQIVEVSGVVSQIGIIRLKVKCATGKAIELGGQTQGESFSLLPSEGKKICGIGGALGIGLQYLYVYFQ
eukprot:TRINITY_DN10331_c0_g1_i1.p1 TRINITY_DN10331_c0_g1~~TRINITY_DN10331_c0_g1_i1.p1  ORF type:complete len:337 (-),score=37.94 TRINITY_DN10331_c0_g1_i1:151-1161(-)